MRYIDHILQPGETLLYTGRLHWIVYVRAMIAFVLAAVVLSFSGRTASNTIGMSGIFVSIALFAIGAGLAFSAWFRRWTTEIDVTDRRVVYKRGFINRHTVEMNMDKVESVDVDQSIMGRLLDYGDITVRGTGETWEALRGIGRPLEFRNHVTAR
jgi:uncharacterized membrane protein YdbT with pleckstrin-like domain